MRNKSTYYLLGFGCGSLAGLLFAPKRGAALRAEIARAAKKRQRRVKEQMSSAAASLESCRVGALRALKRTIPSKRALALFR